MSDCDEVVSVAEVVGMTSERLEAAGVGGVDVVEGSGFDQGGDPGNRGQLVAHGSGWYGRPPGDVVRVYKRITSDDADHQEATRSLSWRQDDDGSMVFTLRVTAARGAVLVAAVTEATRPEAGVPIAARRADTLLNMALGDQTVTPTVMIVTTPDVLAGQPGPCATDHGIALDAETVALAACDGPVIAADQDGTYTQHRYPTLRTRRHLMARDRTCRFPGCHHTSRLDAHHLIHWIHGGPRHPANLVLVCPGHHRLIHRQHLSLRFEADQSVSAWRSDGTRIDTTIAPGLRLLLAGTG